MLKNLFQPEQVKIEKQILSIAEKVKDLLLPQDLENIRDDIEYNEFGNAFENLCIQLFEYQSSITAEIYSELESVGKDIGYDEKTWDFLKILIKK